MRICLIIFPRRSTRNYAPVWIFYRSPEPMNGLSQLKGKRVSMNPGSRRTDAGILAAYGVNDQNTTFLSLNAPIATKALLNGEADAIFISQEVSTPNVAAARPPCPADERGANDVEILSL